jgi:hypothetical protein
MAQRDNPEVDSIAASSVEFHEESQTFRTEFDQQTRQPSEAIIAATAEVKDEDPTALPLLFNRIDPDALDTFFQTTSNQRRPPGRSITFEYVGCQITVNGHGTVIVDPSDWIAEEAGRKVAFVPGYFTCASCGGTVFGLLKPKLKPIQGNECPHFGSTEFEK